MYKYKCNAVGECPVADRGELITSETMLNDPKCSCGYALKLVENGGNGVNSGGGDRTGRKTGLVVAAVAAALVLVGGGTWYTLGAGKKEKAVAEAPAPAVVVSLPAVAEPVTPPPVPAVQKTGGGIPPSDNETSNARREADKKLSSGEFLEAEKKAARSAALEIIKTAVAKMGQGDLIGAEKELMQARERDATESLIYYNLAIVRLRQQKPEEALKQLEAAFMAGFTHFDAMDKDTDLDSLRQQPNFKKLMGIYRKSA
ncbi:tetratricopeptide repeat protein [Polaromonas sp.]|uniref:tetratricopeptide repeat protein n=1 Tax=Polaromonas sp. TaxID=1869339 RepID=UPI003BB7E6FF